MAGRTLKSGTVTRLTGFQAGVLRAWERRFRLLEPERSAGGHRLYTDDDLRILMYVREQIGKGRGIGAIARQGRQSLLAAARTAAGLDEDAEPDFPTGQVAVEPWGKRKSFVTELGKAREALIQAAVAIDPHAVHRAVEQAFALVEPVRAVNEVLVPGARAIGELWAQGRCSVAGEHLVTVAIQDRVRQLITHGQLSVAPDAPEVLVACFPGEQHRLPGLMVARELSSGGLRTVWLGGALPLTDLEVAVDTRKPKAVVLSVTLSSLYRQSRPALREFLDRWPGLLVLVGGRGAPATDPELEELGLHLGIENIGTSLRFLAARTDQ